MIIPIIIIVVLGAVFVMASKLGSGVKSGVSYKLPSAQPPGQPAYLGSQNKAGFGTKTALSKSDFYSTVINYGKACRCYRRPGGNGIPSRRHRKTQRPGQGNRMVPSRRRNHGRQGRSYNGQKLLRNGPEIRTRRHTDYSIALGPHISRGRAGGKTRGHAGRIRSRPPDEHLQSRI